MKPWDLRQTYDLVERVYDRDQANLARASLRSVVDRQNFASYHFQETQRLLKSFKRKHLTDKNLLIALHASRKTPARVPFEVLMIKAGAHVTACLQAIHAIPDLLASGIYFAMGFNLTAQALPDRDVSITSIAALLRRSPSHASLAAHVSRVASGSEYEHLAALSNLSKHRTIVRTALSEDWTGTRKEPHEFQLPAFSRSIKSGQKNYPAVSFASFTESEYNRLSLLILEIGHEINSELTRIAP